MCVCVCVRHVSTVCVCICEYACVVHSCQLFVCGRVCVSIHVCMMCVCVFMCDYVNCLCFAGDSCVLGVCLCDCYIFIRNASNSACLYPFDCVSSQHAQGDANAVFSVENG